MKGLPAVRHDHVWRVDDLQALTLEQLVAQGDEMTRRLTDGMVDIRAAAASVNLASVRTRTMLEETAQTADRVAVVIDRASQRLFWGALILGLGLVVVAIAQPPVVTS